MIFFYVLACLSSLLTGYILGFCVGVRREQLRSKILSVVTTEWMTSDLIREKLKMPSSVRFYAVLMVMAEEGLLERDDCFYPNSYRKKA